MSLFITFEGGEGSGKSAQTRALYSRLSRLAVPALLVHEPGITSLGKKIAHLLKWAQDTDISPVAELLLFNASRAQLVTEVIQPNLKSGRVVICDRYADSTTAYQGYGRGLDLEMVRTANDTGMQGTCPDLTVLLDISADDGFARKRDRRRDRFEQENAAFHQRVREGYLKLAASEPQRWLVVDASQPRAKVEQIIWQRVSQLLTNRSG